GGPPPRLRGDLRRPRLRRQPRQRWLAAHQLPRTAVPAPAGPVLTDSHGVFVGSGPGGATVAEVLTAAGWSVVILEKGRNHLLDLAAPPAPLRPLATAQ